MLAITLTLTLFVLSSLTLYNPRVALVALRPSQVLLGSKVRIKGVLQ